MKTKTSGSGVKAAKVAKEIAGEMKPWHNTKADIMRVYITKENVMRAGLRYKKELFPLVLAEYEKCLKRKVQASKRAQRQRDKKEKGARNLAELDELILRERKLKTRIFVDFPYRQSESRWAEPENSVDVRIRRGKVKGWCNTSRTWSGNGKWSGNQTAHYFQIPKDWDLNVTGGMVTATPLNAATKLIKPAVWWSQGKGFAINQHEGWLIKGYHSEAESAEKALAAWKVMKKRQITAAKKMETKTITPQWCHVKFGWCLTGIRSFMNVNNIESDSITIKELRNIVIKNREINCKNYRYYLRRLGIILNCK